MKILYFLFLLLAVAVPVSRAQTACGETDYKCQLAQAERALRDEPGNAEHHFEIGVASTRLGEYERGVAAFTRYLAAPGISAEYRADAFMNRGLAHHALKRYELAVADFTKTLELNPKEVRAFVHRANTYSIINRNTDAMADLNRAVALEPRYAQAYADRGRLLVINRSLDAAMSDLIRASTLDPDLAEPYIYRATVYHVRGEHQQAIEDADDFLQIGSDEKGQIAAAYLIRGASYSELGQNERALGDLNKAIEMQPSEAEAYDARAKVYRRLKKEALAKTDEQKAAALRNATK